MDFVLILKQNVNLNGLYIKFVKLEEKVATSCLSVLYPRFVVA